MKSEKAKMLARELFDPLDPQLSRERQRCRDLFGINVGGSPLAQNGSGFFLIVGTLAALTAVLAYLGLLRHGD